uniref:Uncharacterized protein n=1 Tax=Cacopsylla melanoneura TaxID=428564 RepID=A0A8D8LQV2_9HEMI
MMMLDSGVSSYGGGILGNAGGSECSELSESALPSGSPIFSLSNMLSSSELSCGDSGAISSVLQADSTVTHSLSSGSDISCFMNSSFDLWFLLITLLIFSHNSFLRKVFLLNVLSLT